MFLVLWGHSIQYFIPEYGSCINKTIFTLIYSFHMPLFAFVSGFFALHSLKKIDNAFWAGGGKLILKRFRELILPCLVMGIYLLIVEYPNFLNVGHVNMGAMLKRYVNCFWFLKALFVVYVITIIFYGLFRLRKILGISFIALSILTCTKFSIWFLLPAFISGMLMNKYLPAITKKNSKICLIISGFVFFLLILFWNKPFYPALNLISIIAGKPSDLGILIGEIYRILVGISGSVFFFFLFYNFLERKNRILMNLGKHGRRTLEIYLLQCILLEDLLSKVIHFEDNTILIQLLTLPLALILLFVFSEMSKFITDSRFLSLIVFAKKAK